MNLKSGFCLERASSSESDDESYSQSSNNLISNDFQKETDFETAEDSTTMGDDETSEKNDDFGVCLNSYDSDLNIIIEEEGTLAIPLSSKALQHLCAGVRATCGFISGRIYYEVKLDFRKLDNGQNLHEFRIGWSSLNSSLVLGEEDLSFGFANVGLVWSSGKSRNYGSPIHSGDVVGALLDMDSDPVVMSYTVNGIPVGIAFKVSYSDLDGCALFPHVLTRNVIFKCNFMSKYPWFKPPSGYVYVGDTLSSERVAGHLQPEDDVREVILVCGLPKSGKTTWIKKFCEENIHKYYVLDCSKQIIKQEAYDVDWALVKQCEKKLRKVCSRRNQKFIFEEDTLSHTTQREMMTSFRDFTRQAVIIIPSDKEYDRRFKESKHLKSLDHFYVEYMKAKFLLPAMGIFDLIIYPELPEDQAHMSISRYNEEGDRYTSCRGKYSKHLQGKNVSKLINSLCQGGVYDVDLSSSSSEAESVAEEINIISASCALRTNERIESFKPIEGDRNNHPPIPISKKNVGFLNRRSCPNNGDQNPKECLPDAKGSVSQQNTRQIPTERQDNANGSECQNNTSQDQQDTNQTQEIYQENTSLTPVDYQQDTNRISAGLVGLNDTNREPGGQKHQLIPRSVPHHSERFQYSRNSETAETNLRGNSSNQFFSTLYGPLNMRESKEFARYPVKNTQIAVYNFSDCKVGLTHEGLGSTHSNNFEHDGQLVSAYSTPLIHSSTGRYSNSGPSLQYQRGRSQQHNSNNRRWHNNEGRPYDRSTYHKAGGGDNINRFSRPFYQNHPQNRGQRYGMSHRYEFPGNYYNDNISSGYDLGVSDRLGAQYYQFARSQHYLDRYGVRERYPYHGYYWSHS